MAFRLALVALLLANILIPIAILIFASGFFPYKPFLSGLAQYEILDYGPPPEAPFKKVIFMVVDALRSDFVYSGLSGFRFTQSLISNGAAIPFTAHATSPTITMPRIKAMTTGSIPSFLDMILNFAESDTTSSLATQDTWLAQLRAKGRGKMVMYGDDTWLKLFPGVFDRADGTSSFFVSDFTEVDANVTRHLPEELQNDDWDTMVLHYLGLDHIGHKAGPRSPNMIPKQLEMDGIVKQIYQAMVTNDHLNSTLLVLCGDHGMNDAGNHGGSAPGETSPALVFISPKLEQISQGLEAPAPFQDDFKYYSTVEQSDIAPTLAALLGFPVPRNNLGAFIPAFLPFWEKATDKLQILLRNARQILSVVTATFSAFEQDGPSKDCHRISKDVDKLACQWRSILQNSPTAGSKDQDVEKWLLRVQSVRNFPGLTSEPCFGLIFIVLKAAQELMSTTASNYDMPRLFMGQFVAALALLLSFVAAGPTIVKGVTSSLPFIAITLAYGIMMFASSYVEEEQNFWFWATSAWLALLWLKSNNKQIRNSKLLAITCLAILMVTRITRRWNQTGQKFAGEPDIAHAFFSGHRQILWYLVGITYLWNLQCLANRGFPQLPQLVGGAVATSLATAAVMFKLAFTNEDSPELIAGIAKVMIGSDVGFSLVTLARAVFICIGIALAYTVLNGFFQPKKSIYTMRTIHDLLTLFLITQSRVTNIPLLLLFDIQFYLIADLDLSLIEITTTSLLLQYMSFFAFGGSNAISSIDLSSAYNGVSGYNVVAVGILTFVSNWTGPIFWTSATNMMLLRLGRRREKGLLLQHLSLLTVFVTSSLVFVMAACTALRAHLFIWTVFSPKYLYSMAWSLGQHLVVNVVFGSLLYGLGQNFT